MPPIIHIKDGLLANLAAIAFLLALATLTVWLYYRGHGQVTIGVWLFAGGFVLCCYFPIGDIREPKSRLLIIEGDDLVWRIHSKEGGDVREERIPLRQIRALEFVIPKRATSRSSRLISCAELYFVTAQGKRALPPDFFPGLTVTRSSRRFGSVSQPFRFWSHPMMRPNHQDTAANPLVGLSPADKRCVAAER